MGIKDNFSQAIKELMKKDGDQPNDSPRPAKPTELDKYLRDEQENSVSANQQPTGQERPSSTGNAANFPQNNVSAGPAQNVINQNAQQNAFNPQNTAPNAQNTQNNNRQGQPAGGFAANAGAQNAYANQEGANINRNVQNNQNNLGQNNTNSAPQGAYNQGGYNSGYDQPFGRPSSQDSGLFYGGQGGGNGSVPPVPNGVPMQESAETEEITVISKNTNIDGNIRSLANMQVDGNIKGNVETTKNIDLSGKIIGDITCNNAGMTSAAMQGNISLKGRIRMDRDTILIGDLSSQFADINGRIRGKLDVSGKVELKRDAIVFGDINTSTIAVADGAIIQGYVNTTFLSKEDSRNVFPEAISIDSKE